MKFLCLGYYNPKKLNPYTSDDLVAFVKMSDVHMETLRNTGQLVSAVRLDTESKVLKLQQGRLEVSERPLEERDEAIGSACIIEAEDMKEAIQIASLHPTVQVPDGEKLGWRLEIRPIHHYELGEG